MVGEAQVEAAPVDVHRGSQEGACHGGALDVPTRTALATRRHAGRLPDPRRTCPTLTTHETAELYGSRSEVRPLGTAGSPLCSAPSGFTEAEAVLRPVSFPELPSPQPGADANPRLSSSPSELLWGIGGQCHLGACHARSRSPSGRGASKVRQQPQAPVRAGQMEAPEGGTCRRPARPSGVSPQDGAVLRCSGEALCP